MKKEFGLIIKMPTEMASQEEIEERKSEIEEELLELYELTMQ